MEAVVDTDSEAVRRPLVEWGGLICLLAGVCGETEDVIASPVCRGGVEGGVLSSEEAGGGRWAVAAGPLLLPAS